MADITYCSCVECINKECGRHPCHLSKMENARYVSIADFGGTCRDYIHQVLIEVEQEG